MAKDDEDWLTALSGKGKRDSSNDAAAEADQMRAAIAAARASVPAVPDLDVDAAFRRFEDAARQEGLMGDSLADSPSLSAPAPNRGGSGRGRRRTGFWASLSALLVAMGAMLYIGSGPALLGTRGGESLPPVYSADPRTAADSFKHDLLAAGAHVDEIIIDPATGTASVTVKVSHVAEPGDALYALLEKHRVLRTTSTRFVVHFVPSKTP